MRYIQLCIMLAYFDTIRQRISAALRAFLQAKRPELARVNPFGPDAGDRLLDFALQGKMIRGCLVPLGYALASAEAPSEAHVATIQTGAAMELFQSGLLVHDDIMDRDLLRRGRPTLFHQYAEAAAQEGQTDPGHSGEALGICAGDVAYFLAFELLAGLEAEPELVRAVIGLCARELTSVGVAQMQDVAWGAAHELVSDKDILRMYAYKTGRYTFSLPLMAGGILAGAPPELLARFSSLGESVGIVFQIRDDELGLFGDERETGKPVGSDIREGKKTLFFTGLMTLAQGEQRRRLAGIFGNQQCTESDIAYVRELANSLGVRPRVRAIARDLEAKARALIDGIVTGAEADRTTLHDLLGFTMERSN
jgi:geranylgeranyl diphosphate synthase type I